MALTMTLAQKPNVSGANTPLHINASQSNLRMTVFTATFDTYPTGGYTLSNKLLKTPFVGVFLQSLTGTYIPVYNAATGKIMLFDYAGVEITNTTDVSAESLKVLVIAPY